MLVNPKRVRRFLIRQWAFSLLLWWGGFLVTVFYALNALVRQRELRRKEDVAFVMMGVLLSLIASVFAEGFKRCVFFFAARREWLMRGASHVG